MMNRTILVGRLTKDPELKRTQTGTPVCRFTLAVNRPYAGENDARKADFITCVAWRKTAENLSNFMRKGNLIGVDGRIETSNFEGQDGKRVFMTDVVADNIQFLEGKNSKNTPPQQQQQSQPPQQSYSQPVMQSSPYSSSYGSDGPNMYDYETPDDLPF